MMKLEEIEKYLPKYLSAESQKELFEELKSFPDNIIGELIYTNKLARENIIFQGDGVRGLLCINLPNPVIKPSPAVVVSNTCDIDTSNKRFNKPRILYAPLFLLNKYRDSLFKCHVETGKKDAATIENHISDIRRQAVTHIFYLPSGEGIKEESIIFFDRMNNCDNDLVDREKLSERRIFTLSNYGFYLFLFKLSVHFTRIREGVDRQ